MVFCDFCKLILGKSWLHPYGSSVRLYDRKLGLECLEVLGVGGVPRLIIAVEVLLDIVEIRVLMFMSVKIVGCIFYSFHEEENVVFNPNGLVVFVYLQF